MYRVSERGSVCAAAEHIKVGNVIRRGRGLSGALRAIERALIVPQRAKSLICQHRGRQASRHSSRRSLVGRANELGLRSHLCVDLAKRCEAQDASFSRKVHSLARRHDFWNRLRRRFSTPLASLSMEEVLRRRSTPPEAWTIILGQQHWTSVEFLDHQIHAGIGSAFSRSGKLICGWGFFHVVNRGSL